MHAATVKTAIALESLLIASDSESLRSALSERVAYILADESNRRRKIARAVKSFYDLRSAVVHGGRQRSVSASDEVLDGMDRLIVLTLLTVSHNASGFEELLEWVEMIKWGGGSRKFKRPFPESHLSRALKLFDRLKEKST